MALLFHTNHVYAVVFNMATFNFIRSFWSFECAGNILNLPWHFYCLVGITFVGSFLLVYYSVNKGLEATGFHQMAKFSLLNFVIGIGLVLLLIYNSTGGIEGIRKNDQKYHDNVGGKNLKFKSWVIYFKRFYPLILNKKLFIFISIML